MTLTRRQIVKLATVLPLLGAASAVRAQVQAAWSAQQTHRALLADEARLLDIRSREEWRETGVARGAWPVSLHDDRFPARLFAARDLAEGRPVAMICATGGRTGTVMLALIRGRYPGFVDVPAGMLGSPAGPGWIAAGLPIVPAEEALDRLPRALL